MKYIAKLKKILKHNNRGAGFVSVLIAVIFLASFGSMLLMVSYTGDEMRKSDRSGKKNMYDAAAVLDEIKAGVQVVCSQAVADTYEYALIYYNDPNAQAVTEIFRDKYRDCIKNFEVPASDATIEKKIFVPDGTGYKYDIESLLRLSLGEDYDDNISVCYSGSDGISESERNKYGRATGFTGSLAGEETPEPIVLKDISVSHDDGDRVTTVTADISIDYPFFDYKKESFTASDIVNFACIIRGNLTQSESSNKGGSIVHGDAYFGSVNLTNSNKLTFEGGTVVTPGEINITGLGINPNQSGSNTNGDSGLEPRFINKGELWAKSIRLGHGTTSGNPPSPDILSVDLGGTVYVANDLELNGHYSKAKITGNYYGFGSQTASHPYTDESGTHPVDAANSSSIVINYSGSIDGKPELDLSSAKNLTLSGVAFIGNSSTSAGSEVQMGESVTVKKVQRAYKVPAKDIYCEDNEGNRVVFNSNPQVMTPDEFAAINPDSWQFFNNLWNTNKTYSDYHATPAPRSDVIAGQSVVYVYVQFPSDEDANRYFLDYYTNNKSEIDSLLDSSVKVIQSSSDVYMPGRTALGLSNGTVNQEVTSLADEAKIYAERYYELQKSLAQAPKDENGEDLDPIKYFLNETNTETLAPGEIKEFKSKDGKVISLIVNGDITINEADYPDVIFLIQTSDTGTVYLERDFTGLIMSSGHLHLADGVELNKEPKKVEMAFEATDTDGSNIIFYTEHIGVGGKGSTWSVYDLVGYIGWNRNTEGEED